MDIVESLSLDSNLNDLVKACLDNARELLAEAKILYKNKSYSRAMFLALTSLEESFKVSILILYEQKIITPEELKKSFKNHEVKYLLNMVEKHLTLDENLENWEVLVENLPISKENVRLVLNVRNDCLYVDYQSGRIKYPSELVTKSMAYQMIKTAKNTWGHGRLLQYFLKNGTFKIYVKENAPCD